MMRYWFLFLFISLSVSADSLTDKIHSVIEGPTGSHIVRFEQGRVGFISSPELLNVMRENIGAEVLVELDSR